MSTSLSESNSHSEVIDEEVDWENLPFWHDDSEDVIPPETADTMDPPPANDGTVSPSVPEHITEVSSENESKVSSGINTNTEHNRPQLADVNAQNSTIGANASEHSRPQLADAKVQNNSEQATLPDTGEAKEGIIPAFITLLTGLGLLKKKKKDNEDPESSK
nr:LPXTG cell wall anchor domain-containing protein [Macrococcus canis]